MSYATFWGYYSQEYFQPKIGGKKNIQRRSEKEYSYKNKECQKKKKKKKLWREREIVNYD